MEASLQIAFKILGGGNNNGRARWILDPSDSSLYPGYMWERNWEDFLCSIPAERVSPWIDDGFKVSKAVFFLFSFVFT